LFFVHAFFAVHSILIVTVAVLFLFFFGELLLHLFLFFSGASVTHLLEFVRVLLLASCAFFVYNLLDFLIGLVRLPVHCFLGEFVGGLELPGLVPTVVFELLLELGEVRLRVRFTVLEVFTLLVNVLRFTDILLVLFIIELFTVLQLLAGLHSFLMKRVISWVVQVLLYLLRVLKVDANVLNLNVLLIL